MKQFINFVLLASVVFAPLNPLHAQWIQTDGPLGGSVCFAVSGMNVFAGGGGGVFLLTNNDTSWTAVNNGLTNGFANAIVYSLAVSPNGTGGTNLSAGTYGGGGVFLSTNNDTSWTAASTGLPNSSVDALAISPASGGTGGTNLFAGTNGHGIFVSTNNGTSWTAASTGLTSTFINTFAVSGTNLFAGTGGDGSGGVFLSTNNGTNWSAASTGLIYTYVRTLAVSDTNLFAGPDGGVFFSSNNGTSWTAASTGLPPGTSIYALAVSGANLFAGTSRGVWRRPMSEMITSVRVEGGSTDLPTHFSLGQNYPNPFNPETNFQFSIANFGLVKLDVYDLLGREVAVLVNEEKQAGTYRATWEATNVTSGVYFYRLRADNYIQTKKMLLTK